MRHRPRAGCVQVRLAPQLRGAPHPAVCRPAHDGQHVHHPPRRRVQRLLPPRQIPDDLLGHQHAGAHGADAQGGGDAGEREGFGAQRGSPRARREPSL